MKKATCLSLSVFLAVLTLVATLAVPTARAANLCVDPAGGSCYTTIQAAVNAAISGDTINIHAGTYYEHVTVNKALSFIGAGTDQTLVDGSSSGRVFEVTDSSSVSFSDLTVQHGNTTGAGGGISSPVSGGSALNLTNVNVLSNTSGQRGGGVASWHGTVTISGGRFENNLGGSSGDRYGGGLYAQYTLIVSGTQFINNTIVSGEGGGAYGNGPTTVTNAQFISNTAGTVGGGLYLWRGAARITDGLFQNNRGVAGGGGGVYMDDSTNDLILNGTQFLSNTADGSGGGICANGNLALTNVNVLSNTATGRGGGAISWGSMVIVMGGRFENNYSSGNYGGGLYAQHTLMVSDTQFIHNTITNTVRSDGGGAYGNGATTVTNSQFIGNVAGGDNGGGLYGYSTLTLFNTQFISNTAGYAGGGAYAEGAATLYGGLFQDNLTIMSNGGGLSTASTLALTDTQFLNNTGQAVGGGAYAAGAATLNGGLFQGNHTNQFGGGGFSTWSTLTMSGTQFINNTALWEGGGAFAAGAATLNGGLFQGNQTTPYHSGGGLYAQSTLVLTGTQFFNNSSMSGGGAYAGGMVILSGGQFEGNLAVTGGGGLHAASGGLILSDTQFLSNIAAIDGGGLLLEGGDGQLTNALFAHNIANTGGGGLAYDNSGTTLNVTNCTFATNSASNGSGLVNNGGTVTVTNCTFSGGGLANTSGVLTVRNSLVANSAPNNNCAGTISGEYNLADDDTCGLGFTNSPAILIGALGDYGGSSQTIPLLPGSAAIDAGDSAVCPMDDQRDVEREQGGGCDIGAFESRGFTLIPSGGDGQSTPINMAFLNPLSVTVTSVYAEPVDGGEITFMGPLTGAGISPSVSTTTITNSVAARGVTANGTVGSYNVIAHATGAISTTFVLTNDKGNTTTSLASSPNPSRLGQTVTFTTAVTAANGIPTGMITFTLDSVILSLPLDATGTVAYVTDTLSVGNHLVSAAYGGDSNFNASSSTLSGGQTVIDVPIINLQAINSSPTRLMDVTFFTATLSAGSNVSYQWAFGDGQIASGATASHLYTTAGSYTASVTATNSAGSLSASTLVTVTNQRPVADAGNDQGVLVNAVVMLDGSGSNDPDGHLPLAYGWIQSGGPAVVLSSAVISRPTFTAPSISTVLTFTLTVTDAFGLSSLPDQVTVLVNDQAITELHAVNDSPTSIGRTTSLTATIGAGSNALYTWDLGDGQTAGGMQVTYQYTQTGVYTATVTATNGAGSISATTLVTIEPAKLYLPLVLHF